MSKARIMGAGVAGSSSYNVNANLNTCGGTKKQGLPFSITNRVDHRHEIGRRAVGTTRDVVFTLNQVGGMHHSPPLNVGGVHRVAPYKYGSVGSTNALHVLIRAIGEGSGAYTVTLSSDGFLSGLTGVNLSNIAAVRASAPDGDEDFFSVIPVNGGLQSQVPLGLPTLILSVDIEFVYINLAVTTVQLGTGSLELFVSIGGNAYISSPTPITCPFVNINLPIDALESPRCTAYLRGIELYAGNYRYRYVPSTTLTSYPDSDFPLAVSFVC